MGAFTEGGIKQQYIYIYILLMAGSGGGGGVVFRPVLYTNQTIKCRKKVIERGFMRLSIFQLINVLLILQRSQIT